MEKSKSRRILKSEQELEENVELALRPNQSKPKPTSQRPVKIFLIFHFPKFFRSFIVSFFFHPSTLGKKAAWGRDTNAGPGYTGDVWRGARGYVGGGPSRYLIRSTDKGAAVVSSTISVFPR